MCMRVNGKMINLMVLENISILMELFMRESGKMINNMVKDYKYGQMDKNIKDSFKWDLNLGSEY